ncbi:protein of unknown function [Xenorhabdus poinarii G6]|uniref:Uncharacterized protein n=1 Tax=Xenorhabdus poinarii G6 TaxID=1354304 RepID=A0A068QZ62_9GAMM|nr:protein of unknown function [Xenorhabdus poinarii G6]
MILILVLIYSHRQIYDKEEYEDEMARLHIQYHTHGRQYVYPDVMGERGSPFIIPHGSGRQW